MNEQRKCTILFAATLLAARQLNEFDYEKPSPVGLKRVSLFPAYDIVRGHNDKKLHSSLQEQDKSTRVKRIYSEQRVFSTSMTIRNPVGHNPRAELDPFWTQIDSTS